MPLPSERINELVQKGPKLDRNDLAEINYHLTRYDVEEAFERLQGTYEAIRRIVSTPDYEGDIELSDLTVDD